MDEALVLCALDLSGARAWCSTCDSDGQGGRFDTEILKEFMLAFARSAQITLHFRLLSGENSHHILEACFKALGRALLWQWRKMSGLPMRSLAQREPCNV